mgnify:CR=1 FL=1
MSRRGLIARLIAAAAMAGLAGCGKKGDPEPPPKEKVRFPRKYPK